LVQRDAGDSDSGVEAVTKSREKGENEFTRQAKIEAARTGRAIGDILTEMLEAARKAKDRQRVRKIVKALKYQIKRNVRKRKK
jgi:hypothetical protein